MLESMMQELNSPFLAVLTKDLHVLPDFHGNRYIRSQFYVINFKSFNYRISNIKFGKWLRSPTADPNAKGMVSGLTLSSSEKELALLYLATVQGIAYGTRHIIEQCNANGHKVSMQFLHCLTL